MKPATLESAVHRSLNVKPRKFRPLTNTRQGYKRILCVGNYPTYRKLLDFAESRQLLSRVGLAKYIHPTLHKGYSEFGDKYVEALLAAIRLTQ